MQELASIFKAEPKSVYDILCMDDKIGYYMPAYQRPYSWTERNIKDLFADLDSVYRRLLDNNDAIIFLGSLLTVDDDGSAIFPKVERHHPNQIKLVIDGQQRLTTLTLLITCLHEQLMLQFMFLKKDIENTQHEDKLIRDLEALEELVLESIDDTSKFVLTTTARDNHYKYQPKIIRSQIDCWGKDAVNASYTSPLAHFLMEYQKHVLDSTHGLFKLFDEKKLDSVEEQVVKGNLKEIRTQLNRVMLGFYDEKKLDKDVPRDEMFIELTKLKSINFNTCLDFSVGSSLYDYAGDNDYVSKLLYLISFTKFVLRRVCLTYVEVNSESYAFDMFEALNTTGEPLTALETFVPKVIEHIQKIDNEQQKKNALDELNAITSRFEGIKKSNDKTKATKALILAFVRAYDGPVKVTHLRDQRDAFLKSYANCLFVNRDNYLEQLRFSSDFLFDRWLAILPSIKDLISSDELNIAETCFRYLVDIKHDISIGLLIQFALKDKRSRHNRIESSEFLDVLKIITAFSVLWRAMSKSADGIDAVYKKVYEKGFELDGDIFSSFSLKDGFINIKADVLKKYFYQELIRKIESKNSISDDVFEQWLEVCNTQLHLDKPDSQKMLILASLHNIEFEDGDFKRSAEERNHFINTTMWNLVSQKDVITTVFSKDNEKLGGWSNDLREIEVNKKLGNLLIDPTNFLKSQGLLGWEELAGKMLAELNDETLKDIDKLFETELSAPAEKQAAILKVKRKFAEITFSQDWNERAVKERTNILLSNAWKNLILWLS